MKMKRTLSLILSLVMIITCTSSINCVFAAEANNDGVVNGKDEIVIDGLETASEFEDISNANEAEEAKKADENGADVEASNVVDNFEIKKRGASIYDVPSGAYNVAINGVSGGFSIEGYIANAYTKKPYYYVFGKLFVDGKEVKNFTGATSISKQSFSLSQFGTGYHTAFLQLYNSNTGDLVRLIFKEYLYYNGITDRPTYNGVFDVYSSAFNYYPYNMALENQSGTLYMEYKPSKSGTWLRTGSMKANLIKLYIEQGYTISGLKANTVYNSRIRYGGYATYTRLNPENFGLTLAQFQAIFATQRTYLGDGKSYFFGGPVLNTTTFKTGKSKKPAVKSISVKAVNVKYHKHRVQGHYEWTGYSYVWIGAYTEKYYTCKYKVTVKLKKKPGTAGIVVNGKYLKGNKKVYTTKLTPYPNYFTKRPPKGMKLKVQVRSYQSKSYGGFSPIYTKTKKVKK